MRNTKILGLTPSLTSQRRSLYLPFGKPAFSDEEIAAVTRVLRSGWIGMGPETIAFEKELSEYLGVAHVITVNSCTSALFLSLLVSGVGPQDEVICPSLTWCSTANAAIYLGAQPIFCDVDPETLCVTPDCVSAKVTQKTKAVIVVHFAGLAVDVEALRKAIPPHVVIIEDAAHAFGALFPSGRHVGASGNLTCFSFYANKNLSTGEGGAIALNDAKIAQRLCSLRQHGLPADAWQRFSHPRSLLAGNLVELGYKMNYTDLQACIGRIQLQRQNMFHRQRLDIAEQYYKGISAFGISCQQSCVEPYHARHLFVVKLPLEQMKLTRDQIVLKMREENIGVSIHYAPLHQMSLYSRLMGAISLVNTDYLSTRIMTLPISASMNISDAMDVLNALDKVIKT